MKKQYQKRTALFGTVVIAIAALSGCQSPTSSSSGYGDYECVKNILGRGYDVFGEYANPDDTRSAILNFDALYKDGKLEKSPREKTEYETVSGTSPAAYGRVPLHRSRTCRRAFPPHFPCQIGHHDISYGRWLYHRRTM